MCRNAPANTSTCNVQLPSAGARHAFTLVELLVVIGIIAALIAILVPALASARRQAELLKCLSGERQITMAFVLHAQEHKGAMPVAGDLQLRGNSTFNDPDIFAKALSDPSRVKYSYALAEGSRFVPMPWQASIAPYIASSYRVPTEDWEKVEDSLNNTETVWKHLACPASDLVTRGVRTDFAGRRIPLEQGTSILLSYNGLWTAAWSSNADYVVNEGLLGVDYRPACRRLGGQVSRLRRTPQIALFTDGQRRQYLRGESPLDASPGTPAPYPRPVPPSFFQDSWQVWTPRDAGGLSHINRDVFLSEAIPAVTTPTVNPADIEATAVADYRQFDRVRHRGRINIAFLDGHCETRMISRAGLMDVLILPRP